MRPFFIYDAVGKVIVVESKTPSIQPIITKPFMFVIDAVITIELRPDIGDDTDKAGVEKN